MQRQAGCNTRSRLEGGCLCGCRRNQLFGHGPSLAESNHVGQLLQQHLVHCVGHVNAVLNSAPRQALCGNGRRCANHPGCREQIATNAAAYETC